MNWIAVYFSKWRLSLMLHIHFTSDSLPFYERRSNFCVRGTNDHPFEKATCVQGNYGKNMLLRDCFYFTFHKISIQQSSFWGVCLNWKNTSYLTCYKGIKSKYVQLCTFSVTGHSLSFLFRSSAKFHAPSHFFVINYHGKHVVIHLCCRWLPPVYSSQKIW